MIVWLNHNADLWITGMAHAVGQGTLALATLWLLCSVYRRFSPSLRYGLWWLACLKLLAGLSCACVVTLALLPQQRISTPLLVTKTQKMRPNLSLRESPQRPLLTVPVSFPKDISPQSTNSVPPNITTVAGVVQAQPSASRKRLVWCLTICWLLGVGVVFLLDFRQWRRLKAALRGAVPVESEIIQEEMREIAALLGMRRLPRLMQGAQVAGPLVTGLLHPMVIVPSGFAADFTPEERRMALAHELAHIRRGDLWLSLVPSAARALFFFHPLLWLAVRSCGQAREEACDLLALRVTGGNAAAYGGLLLRLATKPDAPALLPAIAMSANYQALRSRIVAMARSAESRRGLRLLNCTFATLALVALIPWKLTAKAEPNQTHGLNSAASSLRYQVIDLGLLDNRGSYATAINNEGQIVGGILPAGSRHQEEAFLWQNGVVHSLGKPASYRYSLASGINNRGQVIASSFNYSRFHHAFLWQSGIQTLPTLPHYPFSKALGINDKGQIVGWLQTGRRGYQGMQVARAFLWANGRLQQLGTLGGDYSYAYGINNRGEAAGKADVNVARGDLVQTHAVLWRRNAIVDLGALGGKDSLAYAVNDSGLAVGAADRADHIRHAFAWQNGVMQDLGGLAQGADSEARAVNAQGVIVGASATGDEAKATHAVLWRGAQCRDLNELIPANTGWVLEQARSINDYDQIVGTGLINGRRHAFLLAPQ